MLQRLDPNSSSLRIVKTKGKTLEGHEDNGETETGIGLERVVSQFRNGSTIVLQALHESSLPLARLCRSLSKHFSLPFQVNAYLTPPGSQGLRKHWDTHDVFILQMHGAKSWRIWGSPIELPREHQVFDAESMEEGDLVDVFELRPGDCAYIPRGFIHDAETVTSVPSLHLTVGVHSTTWLDLIQCVLNVTADKVPDFRRGLPIGFANHDIGLREVLHQEFEKILEHLSDEKYFHAGYDRLAERFVQRQRPILSGHLLDLEAWPNLKSDTRVQKRQEVVWRVLRDSGMICLHFHGKKVKLPQYAEEALRFILHEDIFNAAGISGDLDLESKMVLVRRLLKEGFLTLDR